MNNYIISYSLGNAKKYLVGKTKVRFGDKCEIITSEKIKAKFYTNKKAAENKVKKLEAKGIHVGKYEVENLETNIVGN